MAQKHGTIHVVQASYGDAMVLEFSPNVNDPNQPYIFMLIDGGPASNERYYAPPEYGRPKDNLFHLLNQLSNRVNQRQRLDHIDTLVLTHDDEDHKQGIQALFASLLANKPANEANNTFNSWIQGDLKMAANEPPIAHIWYNSLRNVCLAQGFPTIQNNWFDIQLEAYANHSNANPRTFNDELAMNRPDTGVTLAMANAVSAGGQFITKGQYTFEFIGPDWPTMKNPRLRKALGGVKSLQEPHYDFTAQMAQKTNQLSQKTSNALKSLSKTIGLKMAVDGSLKNRSSIALYAHDVDSKILLLGDGVARMFYDSYNKVKANPPFSVMKVMHHGSYHNNFWGRDRPRLIDEITLEGRLPILKKMDNFLKSVTFFFAKVPAKKYIISASSFDVHPNPHISTLIGIITAAQENQTQVDIYLTNHLSPWVVVQLGLWFFESATVQDIPNARFWLLADRSHHGSVAIYAHEADSNDWIRTEARDMFTSFPNLLKTQNPTIAQLAAEMDGTSSVRPKKKLKTTGDSWGLFTMYSNAAPNFASIRPPSVVDAELRFPGSRHVSASLIGTSAHMNHSDLSEHEWLNTIVLNDFQATLQYLTASGSVDTNKANIIQQEIRQGEDLKLGALALFFLGTKESEKLLASLPCTLDNTPQYLEAANSPYSWTVTDFSAKVVDSQFRPDMVGWQGLYSISFNAHPTHSSWTLPLNNGKATHHFEVDGSLNFVILWPRYVQGIASVTFRGQLTTTTQTYHAVANLKVMSDQNSKYRMMLCTPNYDVDRYAISLVDLALLFNTDVDFKSSMAKIVLEGFKSSLDDMVDTKVTGAGFTLDRVLSKVIVSEIFGEKDITGVTEKWNPLNSSHFSLHPTLLRVVVGDAYSESTRQVSVHVDGNMNISLGSSGSDPEVVPFRLSAQYTVNQFMLYEISLYPGPNDSLSIGHLLDILGISSAFDLKESFPGISNLSNALSISHVVCGWKGSLKPEYLKFTVSLDDWVIAEDIVEVNSIQVDVEVGGLSSKSQTNVVIRGWGVVTISRIEIEAFFSFIKNDAESGKDLISVQVASQQRPIPLGSIISHFLGESAQILPPQLSQLLEETNLNRLVIQGERDGASGWSVTKIQVAMSIRGKINVFSNMEIGFPTLMVEVAHPFDQKARSVYAGIEASVSLGDIICKAEIIVVSATDSLLSVNLQALDRPVTIEAILSHFIPDYGNVKLPAGLAFLAGIGIQGTSLTLEISNGKFSMTELSVTVVSSSKLKLWNEITLDKLTLHFSKSQYTKDVRVEFDAMLLFNKTGSEFLTITLLYGGPTVAPATTSNGDQERTLVAPVGNKGSWSAHASYEGRISTIDILASVSGIDLRRSLADLDIPVFTAAVDLVITGLELKLDHSSESSSFSFDAKTEWLCFSHLRFACAKTSQWTYSFGFDIDTGANYGDVIPYMNEIKKYISLEDMSVAIYNGSLDVTALRPSHAKLQPQKARGVSLAVAARFVFGKGLKKVGDHIDTTDVYIIGMVSKDSVFLSASLTGNMSICKSMTITELSAIVECKSEDGWAPTIGVRGSAVLDFGKDISANPIETSVTLFIRTIDFGLGFTIKVKSWRTMFGIEGMDLEDVTIEAAFPPEQFPVPSTFSIAGKIKLHVNNAKIDGSIMLHVTEENLARSYAVGSISGLYLSNILGVFTDIDFGPPGYLDCGFGPLSLSIVPQDMRDIDGKDLKQQFKLSGSMQLPIIHFKADIDIDITPDRLHVDGNLTPISIPFIPDKLFSILASPHEEGAVSGVRRGPSIRIHVGDSKEKPVDANISGMISFLGMTNEVNVTINETGLKFLLAQDVWTKGGSFNGELNSTRLKVHADYSFALDLVIPDFSLGDIKFDTIRIIDFAAKLDVEVAWQNPAWNLVIGGRVKLFGLGFDKTFSIGMDLQDLKAIGKKIADLIKDAFGVDLVAALKKLGEEIGKALTVLKDFGLSVANRVKVMVNSCGKALAPVLDAAKKVFNLAWNEVGAILKDLGHVAAEAAKILTDLGSQAYDTAVAIGKAFGSAAKTLCANILRGANIVVNEITNFFKTTFASAAHEIIDILTEIGCGSFEIVNGVSEALEASVEAIFDMLFGSKPTKSRSQVQEQLLLSLMIRANELLPQRVKITSAKDLEEIMSRQARDRFRYMFGYDFNGKDSKPISCVNPNSIRGGSFKAVYQDGQKGHALDEANEMFKNLNLDSWMLDEAKQKVNNQINMFAGLIPANDWKATMISMAYLPKDTSQNPIHANGIIIFANGNLVDAGHHVTQTIFFYLSVFYEVLPETKIVRKDLSVAAYKAAASLVNADIPNNDDGLEKTLGLYGVDVFKKQHGPSDQWAQPAVPGSQNRIISSLVCFENGDDRPLQPFISTEVLGKTTLPGWSTTNIQAELSDSVKTILSSSSSGSWNVTKIDSTFSPPQAMLNPIATKAALVWYKAQKITSRDVNISLAYVFFYGTYYPVMNPAFVLRNDLVGKLSLTLIDTMKEGYSDFDPSLNNMKTNVERYARQEFFKRYQYDFLDEYSTPNDRHGDEPMHAARLFQEFEGVPQTKDLDQWSDTVINTNSFPLFKDTSALEDFRNQIRRITEKGTGNSENRWTVIQCDNRYDYSGNAERNIICSGILVFSNGHLVAQNEIIDVSFVYFLGVFYVGDVIDW